MGSTRRGRWRGRHLPGLEVGCGCGGECPAPVVVFGAGGCMRERERTCCISFAYALAPSFFVHPLWCTQAFCSISFTPSVLLGCCGSQSRTAETTGPQWILFHLSCFSFQSQRR